MHINPEVIKVVTPTELDDVGCSVQCQAQDKVQVYGWPHINSIVPPDMLEISMLDTCLELDNFKIK